MHKTQLKSLKSVFETLKIIHLTFVKTQFAFSVIFEKQRNTLLNYKDQISDFIYFLKSISNLIRIFFQNA